MKVLIIDFYDSFTFNIASEFYQMGVACKVVSYDKNEVWKKYWNDPNVLILLGPGPGHPNDYLKFIDQIKQKTPRKLAGICLGHQILLSLLGLNISQSRHILHGMVEEVDMSSFITCNEVVKVQRYNSLCVHKSELLDKAELLTNTLFASSSFGEIQAFRSKNILSYQFHPESIGTFCRSHIFESFRSFFYNRDYDTNQNCWNFKDF